MNRRDFLKYLAAAGTQVALMGSLIDSASSRDLIVVSSAGGEGSLNLIDPATLELLATLPFAGSFAFAATRWDIDRDLIWSSGPGKTVAAWRLSTGERLVTLETGSTQNYTELTPDGRHLIVAARFADRFLDVVADPLDQDFGRVVAQVDSYPGSNPCDITISPDGAYAYAPEPGGNTISVLTFERFGLAATTPVVDPVEPYMATASPGGGLMLVENMNGTESIYDLADPLAPLELTRLGAADGLGMGPISSEITPDGRFGVVICRDSSELALTDMGSGEIVATLGLPSGSRPINGTFVYGGSSERFFVALPGRDALAVVRVPEFELEELIPVGPMPLGVVHLRSGLPQRESADARLGVALDGGRKFPPGCPYPCCGPV